MLIVHALIVLLLAWSAAPVLPASNVKLDITLWELLVHYVHKTVQYALLQLSVLPVPSAFTLIHHLKNAIIAVQ